MLAIDGSIGQGCGQVLREFLGIEVSLTQKRAGAWLVEVASGAR